MGVLVICVSLLVSGINDHQVNNIYESLIDNKTNISSGNGFSEASLINLNNKRVINISINTYKNIKPKEGEVKIKRSAKVDVKKVRVPKERVINAIKNEDKKFIEEDIAMIAEEFNISVYDLKKYLYINSKKEIKNVEKVY